MRAIGTSTLLALLLCPALSAAAPAERPVKLNVVVTPQLRLAEGGRATIRVASTEIPLLSSSVGRIEALREVSSGLYEAELVPPDSTDPLIAIVTASTPAGFGWAPITLVGMREVEVRAKARTLVTVEVEGQSFGPVPASATGRAFVRVDVPPGARFATSGKQRIPLEVPSTGFAHVVVDRPSVAANSSAELLVRSIAVSDQGKPVSRSEVRLEASEGVLSPIVELEPGVFQARWRVEPGRMGQARVTAKVSSRPPSTATATLERVAGAPRAIEIEFQPGQVVAGKTDELRVTARVVDSAGNPTDSPARLVVSLGTGDAARVLPDAVLDWQGQGGVYAGRVLVPRQFAGRNALELKVLAPGPVVGTREVPLTPGAAKEVRIEPEDELYADGRERDLRVTLVDQFGNAVPTAKPPEVTATTGSIGQPEPTSFGGYRVGYRSPINAGAHDEVIRARFGEMEGEAQLPVRASGGTLVLAPKIGWVFGSGDLSSLGLAGEVGLWRGWIGATLEGRWFTLDRDDDLPAGQGTVRVGSEASFLAAIASVAVRRQLGPGIGWASIGGGAVRASTTVKIAGQPDLTGTEWAPTAQASVSYGVPLWMGAPFGEVQLGWQGELKEGPLRGSIKTVTVNVGYRFDVF
jgi:hypothetical protein